MDKSAVLASKAMDIAVREGADCDVWDSIAGCTNDSVVIERMDKAKPGWRGEKDTVRFYDDEKHQWVEIPFSQGERWYYDVQDESSAIMKRRTFDPTTNQWTEEVIDP